MDFLIERLSLLGIVPACNGIAVRAPHIFGYCFILCYRCTFIFVFYGLTLWFIRNKKIVTIKRITLLALPMLIDGGLQTLRIYESTNFRRSLTGALFGIACGYSIKYLWQKIDQVSTHTYSNISKN